MRVLPNSSEKLVANITMIQSTDEVTHHYRELAYYIICRLIENSFWRDLICSDVIDNRSISELFKKRRKCTNDAILINREV